MVDFSNLTYEQATRGEDRYTFPDYKTAGVRAETLHTLFNGEEWDKKAVSGVFRYMHRDPHGVAQRMDADVPDDRMRIAADVSEKHLQLYLPELTGTRYDELERLLAGDEPVYDVAELAVAELDQNPPRSLLYGDEM